MFSGHNLRIAAFSTAVIAFAATSGSALAQKKYDSGASDTEIKTAYRKLATAALEGVPNLTGPEDLLGAPCSERGAWMVAGAPVTLDRAPDTESFVEAYGPDVGTWMRLVPVYGPRTHFLVAVAPLGDAWRVIGVTGDGG